MVCPLPYLIMSTVECVVCRGWPAAPVEKGMQWEMREDSPPSRCAKDQAQPNREAAAPRRPIQKNVPPPDASGFFLNVSNIFPAPVLVSYRKTSDPNRIPEATGREDGRRPQGIQR